MDAAAVPKRGNQDIGIKVSVASYFRAAWSDSELTKFWIMSARHTEIVITKSMQTNNLE
jgi:hypothetical protein